MSKPEQPETPARHLARAHRRGPGYLIFSFITALAMFAMALTTALYSADLFGLPIDKPVLPADGSFLVSHTTLTSSPPAAASAATGQAVRFPQGETLPPMHLADMMYLNLHKRPVSMLTLPGGPSSVFARSSQRSPGGPGELLVFVDGEVFIQTANGPIAMPGLADSTILTGFTPANPDPFSGDTMQVAMLSPEDVLTAPREELCDFGRPAPSFFAMRPSYGGFGPNLYRQYVETFAKEYGISAALVYAIMRTESNFNPLAVSRANAFGLMQIVPNTAGGEVHAFLTGERGIPPAELLLSPEENIRYGTVYLHILLRQHFYGVKNSASRELCAIAAYNGGSGSVYGIFGSNRATAIARINEMTPGQVYTALVNKMPYAESRLYVDRVLNAMHGYGGGRSTGARQEAKQPASPKVTNEASRTLAPPPSVVELTRPPAPSVVELTPPPAPSTVELTPPPAAIPITIPPLPQTIEPFPTTLAKAEEKV